LRERVFVCVRNIDSLQVPTNGQTEEYDLEGGDEELENKQTGVSVDAHQVFPAESGNVDGAGEAGDRVLALE
jgi:hypothetical protein